MNNCNALQLLCGTATKECLGMFSEMETMGTVRVGEAEHILLVLKEHHLLLHICFLYLLTPLNIRMWV